MKNKHGGGKKAAFISNLIIATVLIGLTLVGSGGVTAVFAGKDFLPLYQGNTEKAQVSLMFNVYWGTEYVEPILAVLRNNGATATFFIGGCWADDNNAMVNIIINHGHEIGTHGFFHLDHSKIGYEKNKEEIVMSARLLEAIGAPKVTLFAPPSGAVGEDMLRVCREQGLSVIMWSKDTIDWRDQNAAVIAERATKNVKNGDLILMHPTEKTLEALPAVLETYSQKGLAVVSVSQNIGLIN